MAPIALPRRPGIVMPAIAVAAVAFALTGCAPASVGTWTTTGALVEAGEARTATLLDDGRVLVAGGFNGAIFAADAGTGFLRDAELYDPARGVWGAAEPMNEARSSHTATLLPDGSVLVIGGEAVDGKLSSAEVFDPGAGTWTAAGSSAVTRGGHTATLLATGLVLVVGGTDAESIGGLTSAEIYDPKARTWTTTGSLSSGRFVHTATLLLDGRVLVAGGADESGRLATAELYDPLMGSWTPTGSMPGVGNEYSDAPGARNAHTATLLADGRVLVTGGLDPTPLATAVVFDPASDTWIEAPAMSAIRHQHAATRMADDSVLVVGGLGLGGTLATAERYIPATNAWTPTGPMVDALSGRSAILLRDGRVLVIGGVTTIEPVRVCELFSLGDGS